MVLDQRIENCLNLVSFLEISFIQTNKRSGQIYNSCILSLVCQTHNRLLGYDLGLYESDSYKILGLEMLGLTPRKRFLGLGPLSYTNPYIK